MSEQRNVSETAETTALMRAVACYEDDEKIRGKDTLAYIFLAEEKRRKIASGAYRSAVKAAARNGLYEYIIARTAYFDEVFVCALKSNTPQIVLLGAGFDTRAYRYNDLLKVTKVFEVDAPFTQNQKIDTLKSNTITCDGVTFVPVDFEKDSLADCLVQNGYDSSLKTLYIWEGVTLYLTPITVAETLTFLKKISVSQSLLSFDYLNVPVDSAKEKITRKDETVLFGISKSEINNYLKSFGYRVLENIEPTQLTQQYLTCENGETFGNIKKTMNIVMVEIE